MILTHLDTDLLEEIMRPRFESLGWTYRIYNPAYQSIVATAEPENIQTLLATKFQDYDLGIIRHENFFALLGNGIFTADGEVRLSFLPSPLGE